MKATQGKVSQREYCPGSAQGLRPRAAGHLGSGLRSATRRRPRASRATRSGARRASVAVAVARVGPAGEATRTRPPPRRLRCAPRVFAQAGVSRRAPPDRGRRPRAVTAQLTGEPWAEDVHTAQPVITSAHSRWLCFVSIVWPTISLLLMELARHWVLYGRRLPSQSHASKVLSSTSQLDSRPNTKEGTEVERCSASLSQVSRGERRGTSLCNGTKGSAGACLARDGASLCACSVRIPRRHET